LVFSTLYRPVTARLSGALRLRGPLAGDPTARILHTLLLGIVIWLGAYFLFFFPFPIFVVRRLGAGAIASGVFLTAAISLYVLRRGSLRNSALIYVWGMWLSFSVLIFFGGGIRSPGLVMYSALPISAAWLFGYRGTLWTAAGCVASGVLLAVLETAGVGPYWYFFGARFGMVSNLILTTLIAAVPVARVMKRLQDALAQSELAQEALRRERDVMDRVMETSPAGILALSRDRKINFANAHGAHVLGTTAGEIRGRSLDSAAWNITTYDGQPLPREERPFFHAQSSGEVAYGMQIAIQPGHKRILLSVNAAPLVNAAGEFDGAVVSVEDVTERRRVEEELLRYREHLQELVDQRTAELVGALDQAQAANRAKTLFLANMSHELRTPLNAILGFSDLMRRDEGVSSKQAEALGIINRSGTHLLALIDDILDMARIESGHRVLEIATVDLVELVRDAMTMMRVPAGQKNLALSIVWSDAPVRLVRVDGPKLRQILVNLVGNAIKYTDAGSVTVRVDSARVDDTGKVRLRMEVQDTGIGIEPEAQVRIFDPFVQLSHPNARRGSGLGLAICLQFAQMMEGAIHVESEPGKGSTFRVELFAGAAEEFQYGSPWEEVEGIVMVAPDQPPFRILVIEDDPANSLLLKQLLEGAGFQVRTAADGETGIAAFSGWQPHFIWLDIHLPGMNGLEVAAQIRELTGGLDVKIAALTASVFDEERDAVLAAGIDDFVRKPYRAKAVFECMERLLGVRYFRSAQAAKPVSNARPHLLAQVATLPGDLKSQLLGAVLLLETERITEVIGLVSVVNPALGAELSRYADAFEFTPIMRAIQSREAV
jgi:PAS domain S-box-containing protein